MIYSFLKNKLASSRGAPQENDAKIRFAIHPQGIRQFHDNCKMPDCCHIGASLQIIDKSLKNSHQELVAVQRRAARLSATATVRLKVFAPC